MYSVWCTGEREFYDLTVRKLRCMQLSDFFADKGAA